MTPRRTRSIDELADALGAFAAARAGGPAPVVGVSGIDGSGKTWLCAALGEALCRRGVRAAQLGGDEWRTAPAERFAGPDWGRTFYERSHRWAEMREQALEPLRRRSDVDLVLFDGIFALTSERRDWFDLAVWVECSFETATQRALARNQEGLDAAALRDEYERVYWPAQRLHIERDRPAEAADWIFENGGAAAR